MNFFGPKVQPVTHLHQGGWWNGRFTNKANIHCWLNISKISHIRFFLDAIASPSTYPCQWVSQSVSQWVDSFRFGDSYRISELVETHTHIPISIWWWSMLTITIHQAFPWQFSHRLNLKVVTLRSGLTIVPYPLPDPLWQLSWNFAPPAIADVALANFIDI